MGKHDEAWMVLKHIHDTNMRARGEPERVFTVSTHRPQRLHPCCCCCCSGVSRWQISVSPCRWTGSKSPNSWTSWWRCRVSQPTLRSRSSSRSGPNSEEYEALFLPFPALLDAASLRSLRFKLSQNLSSLVIDLVDFHEMLQLPSERQHHKTGCSLVYSVFWVRVFTSSTSLCYYSSVTLNDALSDTLLSHRCFPA